MLFCPIAAIGYFRHREWMESLAGVGCNEGKNIASCIFLTGNYAISKMQMPFDY
jgi:hypothetical protein